MQAEKNKIYEYVMHRDRCKCAICKNTTTSPRIPTRDRFPFIKYFAKEYWMRSSDFITLCPNCEKQYVNDRRMHSRATVNGRKAVLYVEMTAQGPIEKRIIL